VVVDRRGRDVDDRPPVRYLRFGLLADREGRQRIVRIDTFCVCGQHVPEASSRRMPATVRMTTCPAGRDAF
jgi:hypothetical protein